MVTHTFGPDSLKIVCMNMTRLTTFLSRGCRFFRMAWYTLLMSGYRLLNRFRLIAFNRKIVTQLVATAVAYLFALASQPPTKKVRSRVRSQCEKFGPKRENDKRGTRGHQGKIEFHLKSEGIEYLVLPSP
jgi:hypothetical protein